ncbi:tRNA guanosine(34) transglycosylase Tgt [Candidatus Gottesmanbacteria bacterium]|nr:tRNA guanosine(34) transglycosylase Tgt [Candidatus Gottesmanbacteria bacterium]
MRSFRFRILEKDKKTKARVGEIATRHGVIKTPAFVPVGTQASIKSLTPDEMKEVGVQLFFVNTYHMYLRPGIEVVEKLGGLHKFMGWDGPIMTDSGGFQVFSLGRSDLTKIIEEGVEFRSHWDGTKHLFTPESSMEWQWRMGGDIHIAFDDCTGYPVTHAVAKKSMERTHRWASRCKAANVKCQMSNVKMGRPYQALYGSIQGSVYEDLRKESAKYISTLDFDGIAIGGVSVGETKKEMVKVLDWVVPILPEEKPRHLLGVGEIDDIFALVEHGIDTFDCVMPTRLARMGKLLGNKEIDITKKIFAEDKKPIHPLCRCYTCTHFSRAYVHHLFHVKELLAYRLATIHNLWFIHRFMDDIRQSIARGTLVALKKKWI